mgnify:CR=1 FL=1
MNNLQSIQYFLPEILIAITSLFVILFDLVSLKKIKLSFTIFKREVSFNTSELLVGSALVCISILLYQMPLNGGHIFHGMLINDSFSYYFKWLILISTGSIILVSKYSNELDILTTFVRGQKNLYEQSRIITQQKLYLLMCPALIIAAAVTFISPFLECDTVNTNIVAGLNGIVTLFISMVGFFKLETLSEKYLILASLFDNSETELELASTKIMIMKREKDISQLIISKFNETEDKITEYKLISQTLILPEIKLLFPIISHVNIFSFIKKIELLKRCTIEKLRNVKNEISYI